MRDAEAGERRGKSERSGARRSGERIGCGSEGECGAEVLTIDEEERGRIERGEREREARWRSSTRTMQSYVTRRLLMNNEE